MKYVLHDGFFFWDSAQGPTETYNAHEMYLKVIAVDLEDEQEIAAFVDRFEPLGMWGGTSGPSGGYLGLWLGVNRDRELERAFTQQADAIANRAEHHIPAESIDDFRYGATSLRDLVNAWIWVNGGEAPSRWECPAWRDTNEIDGPPKTARDAATLLTWGVTEGLARLGLPHILLTDDDEEPDPRSIVDDLPLYSICCLELYNHIVERLPYRQCANETCQRLFVRQSGRAKLGQHRTLGVKYCSHECARAQAQREHRRRKRQQT